MGQTAADKASPPGQGHYKDALKLSSPAPPSYSRSAAGAGTGAGEDSPPENEYAYVEDFLPTPPMESVPMNKMLASYPAPASALNHYGALGLSGKQAYPVPVVCGGERAPPPRHYFELDVDMMQPGALHGGNAYAQRGGVGAAGGVGMMEPPGPGPAPPLSHVVRYPGPQYT